MKALQSRAENLGNSLQGVSTWITYVNFLEDWGNPAKALEECRNALGRFNTSPSLLAFTVPFLARMGEWEEAEQRLQILQASEARGYFHKAAVYFNEMRCLTANALDHAEAWVSEFPLSIQARNRLLSLVLRVYGQTAALERATQWMRECPENEDFEEAFCRHSDFPIWRKLRVLKARVQRNPEDGWAWRELTFAAISLFEKPDETQQRPRLKSRVATYLAEADRVAADDAATIRAHGLWHEAQCNWDETHACYLESIRRDPTAYYGYQRAFETSSRFSDAGRRAMWNTIEPVWLATSGHLPNCLEMMGLLNGAFGPRETERIIAAWQKLRPDDPNVAEAMADLLLDHGHGHSDAARALEMLRSAVERYPYNSGLRFSLAKAHRATGNNAAAELVFEELVRRRPDNTAALIQLSWISRRNGETDQALRTLTLATEQEPQSPDPLDTRAQILIESHQYDRAFAVVADALRKLPTSVSMYERAIRLFSRCGDDAKAVDAARQGVRVPLRSRAK